VSQTQNVSATNVARAANRETFVSATRCPQQCLLVCQGLNIRLVYFQRPQYNLSFLSFLSWVSFMAHANLATSLEGLVNKLTSINSLNLCSSPVFRIKHFFIYTLYFLYRNIPSLFVHFDKQKL